MSSSSPGGSSYHVVISDAVAKSIQELQRRASRQGRGDEFLTAMRRAADRLRGDPTAFGEPLYRLPALQLQVRFAVIRPLVIHFAVHQSQPYVFVKYAKLLSKGRS